jgi:NADH:ubiquinone oxidoreductase subunit 6 (subunit J)
LVKYLFVSWIGCYILSDIESKKEEEEEEREKERKWEAELCGSLTLCFFSLLLMLDPMPPITVTATEILFLFTPTKSVPFTIPGSYLHFFDPLSISLISDLGSQSKSDLVFYNF